MNKCKYYIILEIFSNKVSAERQTTNKHCNVELYVYIFGY